MDESLGRITALLAERQMLDDTLVIFMGDNGFAFGEHGLIDKRTAYESSMRVPLVMAGAGLPAATTVSEVVANIDIAPSILDAAGLTPPAMDGRSFLPLARGERVAWREALLYKYYWERNFPQTPTIHAVRGARYKYIRYYGLWDTDELYDLMDDPARDQKPRARPRAEQRRHGDERRAVRSAGRDRRHVYSTGARSGRRLEPSPSRRVHRRGLSGRAISTVGSKRDIHQCDARGMRRARVLRRHGRSRLQEDLPGAAGDGQARHA